MFRKFSPARFLLLVFSVLFLACGSRAQVDNRSAVFNGAMTNSSIAPNWLESAGMNVDAGLINSDVRSHLDSSNSIVSVWDLKAPGKARKEYERGYQLLLRKQLHGALEFLKRATIVYPKFVAAHNALGSTYLGLNQNEQARAEFVQALSLDDHVPISHFNLACAQLALKDYPSAEQSLQKASTIAPLDPGLLTALAYAQYMEGHYESVIETAQRVQQKNRVGPALVHFFAAAAWEAKHNFSEAEQELRSFFSEDPKSPAAPQAEEMMTRLKQQASYNPARAAVAEASSTRASEPLIAPTQQLTFVPKSIGLNGNANRSGAGQTLVPRDCPVRAPSSRGVGFGVSGSTKGLGGPTAQSNGDGPLFRTSADEVQVFFSATDRGKPVLDLTSKNLSIRDRHQPPAAITSLRNESELPLRIGLIIDTSDSITYRFRFEQKVIEDFLQSVMNSPNDQAFVLGFSNTVLMVQDFATDHKLLSHAVEELAPSGGTALWDAVDLGIEKLANRAECQPVARMLFVISDGEENSSNLNLDQVIGRAEQAQVSIYSVVTREATDQSYLSLAGEHALKRVAELTGGAVLDAAAVHGNKNGTALQRVIRNRYFVSYKPDRLKRNGEFHTIEIAAEKDGRKLRVYARKGYFAATTPESAHY